MKINSNFFANDTQSNIGSHYNPLIWVVFIRGNVTIIIVGGGNSPTINATIPDQNKGFNPGSWTLDLTSYENDTEDNNSGLTWSVLGVNPLFMDININSSTDVVTFDPRPNISGMDKIVFILSDSGGYTDMQEITVSINRTIELIAGWNLFSVPILENNSVQYVLAPLGNGNWGCGHDDSPPYNCIAGDGDFVGNWTILWTTTQTGSWINFKPDVYYPFIQTQDIQTLEVDKGYWIETTQANNITLAYG